MGPTQRELVGKFVKVLLAANLDNRATEESLKLVRDMAAQLLPADCPRDLDLMKHMELYNDLRRDSFAVINSVGKNDKLDIAMLMGNKPMIDNIVKNRTICEKELALLEESKPKFIDLTSEETPSSSWLSAKKLLVGELDLLVSWTTQIGERALRNVVETIKVALAPVEDNYLGLPGKNKWDADLKAQDAKVLQKMCDHAAATLCDNKAVAKMRPILTPLELVSFSIIIMCMS